LRISTSGSSSSHYPRRRSSPTTPRKSSCADCCAAASLALLADVDFATLRRLLVDPDHRFEGVDYDALAERLRREDIRIVDYMWLMRLAAVHAFLAHGTTTSVPRAVHV
jgi:hypothetical protein